MKKLLVMLLGGLLWSFAGLDGWAQPPWLFERLGYGGGLDIAVTNTNSLVKIRTTHEAFLCVYGFTLDQAIVDYGDQFSVADMKTAGYDIFLNPKGAIWLQVIAIKTRPIFECDSQHLRFYRTANELSDSIQSLLRGIPEYGSSLWSARFIYLGVAQPAGDKIQSPLVNQDPVPLVVWKPQIPFVGDVVEFDASRSYDPDGDRISWVGWDLNNDGIFDSSGIGLTIRHRFSNSGLQKVTVTLKDSRGGQSSAVLTLRVNPKVSQDIFNYTINAECVIVDGGSAKEYVLVAGKYYTFNATGSSFRSVGWDFDLNGRNDAQAVAVMAFPPGIRYIALNGVNSVGEFRGEQIKLKIVHFSELAIYCKPIQALQAQARVQSKDIKPASFDFKLVVVALMVVQVVAFFVWFVIDP